VEVLAALMISPLGWRTLLTATSRGTAETGGVLHVIALRMDASLRKEGDFRTRADQES
jgi:hypothetical protein